MGWTVPLGVTKLRSTTTGMDVGLRSARLNPSVPSVDPPAKYHVADVVLWHGATDQPDVPSTVWLTETPPPASVTVCASQLPDDGAVNDGTTVWRAGTDTAVCSVAPVSVTVSMVAATGRAVVLANTSWPGSTPEPAEPVDCPVQYQADDSASTDATCRARQRRARLRVRACPGCRPPRRRAR